MTEALKRMVEAMAAEIDRQAAEEGSPYVPPEGTLFEGVRAMVDGSFDLEKVARAGLEAADREVVARALAKKALERHAQGSGEDASQSRFTLTQPDRLKRLLDAQWPRFADDARAVIDAILGTIRDPT